MFARIPSHSSAAMTSLGMGGWLTFPLAFLGLFGFSLACSRESETDDQSKCAKRFHSKGETLRRSSIFTPVELANALKEDDRHRGG